MAPTFLLTRGSFGLAVAAATATKLAVAVPTTSHLPTRGFRIAPSQQNAAKPQEKPVPAPTPIDTSKLDAAASKALAAGGDHLTQLVAGRPYKDLAVGVPKEVFPGEKRVAMTPANVARLLKAGFKKVNVEKGAGAASEFSDADYAGAGATIVDSSSELCGFEMLSYLSVIILEKLTTTIAPRFTPTDGTSDVVLKIRPPQTTSTNEIALLQQHSVLISLLFPGLNPKLVEELAQKKLTALAMDCIPRISRAQSFDVLSSMANIVGWVFAREHEAQWCVAFRGTAG